MPPWQTMTYIRLLNNYTIPFIYFEEKIEVYTNFRNLSEILNG